MNKITITLTQDQLSKLVDIVYFSTKDKTHNSETLAFEKRILKILWDAEKAKS